MSASPTTDQKLFGLFELDATGTVLYSRVEPDGDPRAARPDFSGRNFYEDVLSFENAEELRRRVAAFERGASPADSFCFECRYDAGPLPVRVLLARVRERSSHERTKSVLVHIRKGA
jgi:hypothetical protein